MSDNRKPTDNCPDCVTRDKLYAANREIDRLKAELIEKQIYILNIERELARYREDV